MQTKTNETWEQQQERERREKKARHLATLEAARTVAAALNWKLIWGGDWTLEPNSGVDGDECRAVLRCTMHGHRIAIDGDNYGHTGKFYVHGWYDFGPSELNMGMPYGLATPSINVSQSRGGEALAKEIERRFMAEFHAVGGKLDERTRAAAEFRATRTGILERLASVVAVTRERVTLNQDRGDLSLNGYVDGNSVWSSIDVHASRSSVDLKISDVSEETAAAIIRLVRGLL
jgi:hypothetical protein